MSSLDACKVAAWKAYNKLPVDRRPPGCTIMEVARSASVLRGSDEPVIVRIKRKSISGYRLVCAFGLENKCLQYLVGEALKARTEFHPCQYANSKGRHAAVLA